MSDLYILKVTSTVVEEYQVVAESEEDAFAKIYSGDDLSDERNLITQDVKQIEVIDVDRWD